MGMKQKNLAILVVITTFIISGCAQQVEQEGAGEKPQTTLTKEVGMPIYSGSEVTVLQHFSTR